MAVSVRMDPLLERQLERRLSDDKLEQAWYWIDLAYSLRSLHREESLPHLLRCADAAAEAPLGHFFAAETVCFLSFGGYLRDFDSPSGRAALKLLHRALEGLRYGLQPIVVIESRLGEVLERLWEQPGAPGHPLLTRVAWETSRFLRRAEHARRIFSEDRAEQEGFDWQIHRLSAIEPMVVEYLADAPKALLRRLDRGAERDLSDLLVAIEDLRIDAADRLLPRLPRLSAVQREQAIAALTWSKDERVGPWLREEARRLVPMDRRARSRRR